MIEERVNLIIEYIEQILSDENRVRGKMEIDTFEKDGEKYKTLDILVRSRGFERHFNLGIKLQDEAEFYRKLLDTFVEKFAESEYIGISEYYFRSSDPFNSNFYGIDLSNTSGSYLGFSLRPSNEDSKLVIQEYNQKLRDLSKNSMIK